jgi:hypothetical protein
MVEEGERACQKSSQQKGKRKSDEVEEYEEAPSSKRQKNAKSGRQPMWTILPYSRLSEN